MKSHNRGRVAVMRRGGAGFTLIEMLFVIAIIGLLAAIILPRVSKAYGKAEQNVTKAQIALAAGAIERFRMDVSRYPTDQEGFSALITKPQGAEGWDGPYLEKQKVPQDGWKRDLVYKLEPEGFVVKSWGADGREGGEGPNGDIDNRS